MNVVRTSVARGLVVLAMLALAACGASSTGQTTGGTPSANSPTATAQPTATPKPKPSSAPAATQQFCQSVMTVADANQIMNPPSPVITITAQSDSELGVCHYNAAQGQFPVVAILILEKAYTGPNPVPESTIEQFVAEAAGVPEVTITTLAPVSGVGDQAEFLASTFSGQGLTFFADAFYVIYGNVAYMCDDFHMNTKPDDATQQAALTQCAQRVFNVL